MTPSDTVRQRAELSCGTSSDPTYAAVERCIANLGRSQGGLLLDVGCGTGSLWSYVRRHFDRYVGADAVRYNGFPTGTDFLQIDLDSGRIPMPDGEADFVAAVEVIEHLENPRGFTRELVRLAKPGGYAVVTTPNQLSLLSKLTLVFKNEFTYFQHRPGLYPAHLTALLEVDLRRIATECGLVDIAIHYTGTGRIPGSPKVYPKTLSRRFPRSLSDNVILIGRKPLHSAQVRR